VINSQPIPIGTHMIWTVFLLPIISVSIPIMSKPIGVISIVILAEINCKNDLLKINSNKVSMINLRIICVVPIRGGNYRSFCGIVPIGKYNHITIKINSKILVTSVQSVHFLFSYSCTHIQWRSQGGFWVLTPFPQLVFI